MSNLIESQMAIDALIDEFKRTPTMAIRAKHVIEQLPPAEPCEDTVSRQVAIDTLLKWMRPICINNTGEVVESDDMVAIRNILKSLPPVQPERKKGKWIHEIVNRCTEKTYCSECGGYAPFVFVSDDYYGIHVHGEDRKTDFCPNCGADMGGEE